MEAIKETIQNVMQRLEIRQKNSAKDNPEILIKKVFSKKEQGHIKINYLRKGVLSISVDSSTWLYHLNLRKENLLEKLHKKSRQIKDIRFYIGEV